jgi:hypothetical protein
LGNVIDDELGLIATFGQAAPGTGWHQHDEAVLSTPAPDLA